MTRKIITNEYRTFLDSLKKRVVDSRYRAALTVNKELTLLYHHIGNGILKAQAKHGWGAS